MGRTPQQAMRVHNCNFTVIFTPAEEAGYVVTCPALPGLVTEGDNLVEARKMVREAIAGYLEVLLKHGQPLPGNARIRAEQIGIKVSTIA